MAESMVGKAKRKASEMLDRISPSARKMMIEEEGSDQVVRNMYEKMVATGEFTGTLEEFAEMRGMKLRKKR